MSFADELVAAFAPWTTPDLEAYLETMGEMFAEVEWYADDTDDEQDGWTVIFDPDRTLTKDLRWLGQIVGDPPPVGHPDGLAREWIKDLCNQRRGNLGAIQCAAQRHLTGARTVVIYERSANLAAVGADVDSLLVITYADQTPYPDKTLKDLQTVVPGDIQLNYLTHSGQLWQDVKANHPTWNSVKTTYTDWNAVRIQNAPVTGGVQFSRPVPA